MKSAKVDALKYQATTAKNDKGHLNGELLTVKLRYKQPEGDVSKLIEVPVKNEPHNFTQSSSDFQFASAVASFGMLLRDSDHKSTTSFSAIADLASKHTSVNDKEDPYRKEFVKLVRKPA
ncbi:MAG: hypothetical protein A2Z20_11725 [Bdellovibrionales bacterium RBG_16_40_8]|nr:MAG: hypothetical protein A2Z20_11725 [Bdellovibrionales bacterium RBG_16_40_8]